MSEQRSALPGARAEGFATVEEGGLRGMITLRGDLGLASVKKAVKEVTGAEVPGTRQVTNSDTATVLWMSPDELLILTARSQAAELAAALAKALRRSHALVVDVSDARQVFRVTGPAADEVMAKLSPVDFPRFPVGEVRRTRLAQVPAAFWRVEEGFEVVVFRSVARYAFDVLATAARAGGEVGAFR